MSAFELLFNSAEDSKFSALLVILLGVSFTLGKTLIWGFRCAREGDVLMMITTLQGLTAESAAGQRRLPGNGLVLPVDVFRQTARPVVIDERQRSD